MRIVVLVLGLGLVGCATVGGSSASRLDAAQRVADLDREVGSALDMGDDARTRLKLELHDAEDAWLRGELRALGDDATDASLSQTQRIVTEAARRGRGTVAQEAEVHEAALLERRAAELTPLIDAGRWLQSLEQLQTWFAGSRSSSPAQQVRQAVNRRVSDAIARAEGQARPGAERFLFQRMKGWLGEPPPTTDDARQVDAVVSANLDVSFTTASCAPAQRLELSSSSTGTPATVQVTLGGCDVVVRRQSGVRREASYPVKVERVREEQYTERVEVTSMETSSQRVCNQVTKNIATTGPKNYITVSECNTVTSQNPVTRYEEQPRTRLVKYLADESRVESFLADTADYEVALDVRVSVTGDGQSVNLNDRITASEHDEAFSRQHGPSRSFRSGIEASMQDGLRTPVRELVRRALTEWNQRRGQARLAQAKLGTPEARRLAIEAVALNAGLATDAAPLIDVNVTGAKLAALIGGAPVVVGAALPGADLPLPPPSAALARRYEKLEERQVSVRASENRDTLVGLGVGLLPTPDGKASGAFSFELQLGYVPEFAAVSALIARVEGDLQLFATSYFQADLSARPEVGVRLGPVDVSAVGSAGGRVAFEQVSLNPDDEGRFTALGYLGYGAHLALHLGPVLVDAMALRLHQLNGRSPIATRADAIIGFGVTETFFLMARLRYLAQADLLSALSTADRFTSLVLGFVLQF